MKKKRRVEAASLTPKKDLTDLLSLKIQLADHLIHGSGEDKEHGEEEYDANEDVASPAPKRRKSTPLPQDVKRTAGAKHMPELVPSSTRLDMSDKDLSYFRNPDNLSISEADRYVLYDSQCDEYSSGDSFRQSGNESSDKDEFDNTTLENSSVLDITSAELSIASPAASDNDIATPGPSHVNTLPSANLISRRGIKAPRPVLLRSELAQ
ncbi:hypothetical protein J6590_089897 [Homalodisca vitripennis]|nr:hypothetical protein J6590_089897 [Homalodisca vitripennis]